MSIDISRLGAHLSDAQRAAVLAQYERAAKSPTAAFLLCFFLGIFGAHRFYLGQTGAGLLRLILSPLLLPGIIWEIYDLLHIDDEVNARNLKLAEHLIADAVLAAPIPAAVAARIKAEPPREGQPDITVVTPISGDLAKPSEPAAPTPAPEPDDTPPVWPVAPAIVTAAAAFAASEAATEAVAPAPATPASSEADLAADAVVPLSAGSATDITAEMVASAAAIADAAAPISTSQTAMYATPDDQFVEEPIADAPPPAAAADALVTAPPEPAAPAEAPRLDDPTDRGPDTGELLALADLGEATGKRVVVRLPAAADLDVAPVSPDWTDTHLPAPTSAALPEIPAETPPDAPLDMSPDAALDASPIVVPGEAEALAYADSIALPLAAEDDTLLLIPDETALAPVPAAPESSESTEPPATLEASPVAAAPASDAAATGTAETQVSEEAFDRFTDTGSHRIVKRVKVVRRLVVNGQVVEEATAEQVVDADADTSATARSLQESLRGNDFQQRIAALSTPITPPPPAPGPPDQADASAADEPGAPADQPAGS